MWGRRKVDEEEARSKVMRNRLDSVLGLDPYGSASKPDARRNSDARQSGGTASAISVSVALADNDGHSLEEEPHIAAARTCCAEPAALHEVSAGTSVRSENCSAQETSAIGVLCCDEAECIASRGLMSDSGRYQGVEVSHGCDSKPGAELECQIPRERPAPSVSAVTGDGDGLPGELGRQQPSACSMRESVKPKTLDSGSTPCVHTSTNVFEPADSNGSELQIRSDINRIDARSATIRTAL